MLEKITDHVYRIPDQFFYGELVNIYVIEQDDCVIVIDGPSPDQHIIDQLGQFGKPLKVILTHGSTARGVAQLQKQIRTQIYLHSLDISHRWLTIDPMICNTWCGDQIRVTSTVSTIHTPGHSSGHCCIYYRNSGGLLFTGDAIYGDHVQNIRGLDQPGSDWHNAQNIKSLSKLIEQYDFQMILPFHYNIIYVNAKTKLQHALQWIKK